MQIDSNLTHSTSDQSFDPFLCFPVEKRGALIAGLLPLCEAAILRKRKRRERDHANFCAVLELVVANALRATQQPVSQRVHYSRKTETYSGRSIYHPQFLRSPTLKAVIDTLGFLGMLDLENGTNEFGHLSGNKRPNWRQSTFQAKPRFADWLIERGITADDVQASKGAPVVRLKDDGKRLISYNPNEPLVEKMIEQINNYNEFITLHKIELDLSEAEIMKMHNTPNRDGSEREAIHFWDMALYRVFNNGDFKQGGRFVGGWWINVPRDFRDHILIDDSPTVELDYSGCFIRMLYHLDRQNMEIDPYEIPAIKELSLKQGLNWEDDVRQAIKELANILVNALPKSGIGRFPEITRALPAGMKRPNKVYELIRELHRPIAHRFQTGCGLQLMRKESDICAGVLTDGIRDGVLVLPIHDSFVVQQRHEDWLRNAMIENYRKQIGFEPVIKKKETDKKFENQELNNSHTIDWLERGASSSSLIGENVSDMVQNDYRHERRDGPSDKEHLWKAILAAHRKPREQGANKHP